MSTGYTFKVIVQNPDGIPEQVYFLELDRDGQAFDQDEDWTIQITRNRGAENGNDLDQDGR